MYVRCDESSLYSRINYVHSSTGNFSAGVSGNTQNDAHTGFSAYTLYYANAPVLTRKKPDVMI